MAAKGWSRFLRRKQSPPAQGGVTRAAVEGEALGSLLERGVCSFLQAAEADRAGVWVEAPHQYPELFVGTMAEAGLGPVPQEWRRLNVSAPFFRALLQGRDAVVMDLEEGDQSSLIGPLSGMRRAIWLPLRVEQRAFGLALVAYASLRDVADLPTLRALADELALAVAQRQTRDLAARRQAEMASWAQLVQAVLRGTAARHLLVQIVAEARREVAAEFLALGQGTEVPRFETFEGPLEWLSAIQQGPVAEGWRAALAEARMVSVGPETLRDSPHVAGLAGLEQVSRMVAVPLLAQGERLGVLLAGLRSIDEETRDLDRLECYAALASIALWQELQSARQREAAACCRALLEATAGWTLLVDPDGVIQEASQAALMNLGISPARLGQLRVEELFPNGARASLAGWRRASAQAGSAAPGPLETVLPNGAPVRIRLRRASSSSSAEPGHWLFTIEDLSVLRSAERRAESVRAALVAVLDAVDSGVVLFDPEGHIRHLNDRFGQLLGLDARRLVEVQTFDALVGALAHHFRDPEAFAERWREMHRRGEEASWDELELIRPTRKVVERFARPVFSPEGARLGWLEIYRDITGQRLIQSKLLQTEKMAALGQLVSGIAHELNNPLTSIMGYAQLLLSRGEVRERSADARKIYQEAERASRIVKNLLLFTRETKPERRPVNLNEIVERTLALRSYELKVENITVKLDLEPDLPATLADANQLQQVVLNLVVNAEQAIQQGRGQGHIRLRTGHGSPQRLKLEVADDGPGIPPEIVSRIFDPFFTTKPVGIGTGLGLSIVYGIVQEHGGEISVESQPGRGATFIVELPIVAAPAEEEPAGEAAQPATATEKHAGLRRERVLVVEDEPTVAELIVDVLREDGRQVDAVLDSREGLERLSREDYDLVICDLKMPFLDGRAFYRALVQASSPLQHRMVFITGDTLAPHTLEFLEGTGLPYLAKPFLVEELKLAVQRALIATPASARAQ